MSTARRDTGRARGKPIEDAILTATLDELSTYGLDGLSVPRVAAAAEVNKTTVYRRWPTREALVAAALEAALRETAGELIDTGSLRGDLRWMLQLVAQRLDSAEGRALARAALSEQAAAAVAELSRDPMVRAQAAVLALVARAAARGEWDPNRHPPDAVLAMLTGSVMHRVLLERQPVTPEWAETVVDVVVRGLG
ncbi:TetR/AcrR family transcriptional regulator [Myxococcota bacterium]|nr:TetR/AcrR family transcriptional regulator [Myxococcota bacterium]